MSAQNPGRADAPSWSALAVTDVAKRIVDASAAVAGLILLSPVLAVVALAVRATMGRPVLFRQERVGRDFTPFMLLKFRTMRAPEVQEEALLSDLRRTTPLGRWLRRSSLDELPTLWNVLTGSMSLVGPRPLLDLHVDLLGGQAAERWSVRPGVTGLAQVNGRQDLTFGERIALDLEYVRTRSLLRDLHILLQTIAGVLLRRGIAEELTRAVDDIGLERTIVARSRREFGSTIEPSGAFAPALRPQDPLSPGWVPNGARWFATARSALVSALVDRGVTRVHLPTYTCHDLTRALRTVMEVVLVPSRPGSTGTRLRLRDDEAAVAVMTFGLPIDWVVDGGTLVLDVTHGPWTQPPTTVGGRTADLALASLRKTLPVPDGGLLWSPAGGRLPPAPEPDAAHDRHMERLHAALADKAAWLRGDPAARPKDGPHGWLADLRAGEASLLLLDVRPRSASTVTRAHGPRFDVASLWGKRQENLTAFRTAVAAEGFPSSRAGEPSRRGMTLVDAPAFVVLIAPDGATRERALTTLAERRIYGTRLWSMKGERVAAEDHALAERLLLLPADARYEPRNMTVVAGAVTEVCEQLGLDGVALGGLP